MNNTDISFSEKFTDRELEQVIEEGMIYMCACPAQVAQSVRNTRALYNYQFSCLEDSGNDKLVHTTIAAAAISAHAILEDCMEKILEIEKWDRTTLTMPEGLRKRQAEEIAK
jgi:hypothetical protein